MHPRSNRSRWALALAGAFLATTGCPGRDPGSPPVPPVSHATGPAAVGTAAPVAAAVALGASDPAVRAELVGGEAVSVDFVPVFVEGQLTDLLFKPSPPRRAWRVKLADGPPRRLGRVKATFTIVAEMKVLKRPDGTPPPVRIATPAPPPGFTPPSGLPTMPPLPTPDPALAPDSIEAPVQSDAAPLELGWAPGELGWPEALAADREAELAFDFSHPDLVAYFRKHPRALYLKLGFRLLDERERPLVNGLGVPLELPGEIRVL